MSLYTSYKFKGALDKLTVGGGARWQGKSWQMVYNNPRSRWEKFSQEDYWLVDLMARYQITDKLSASVTSTTSSTRPTTPTSVSTPRHPLAIHGT